MSNPNPLSLLFICLTISSSSFILICKADASKETGTISVLCFEVRHGLGSRLLGTSTVDNSRKALNRPLKGIHALTNGEYQPFNYIDGAPDGPKKWGTLSPDWKICADGKFQSPINIDVLGALDTPSDLKWAYKDAPAKLVNGYNNIAVEWLGDAGGIEVNGSTYKLLQCHWHIPSEHTINGKKFDAELHLVHENDKGQKSVIGTLQTVGQPDPFIASLTEKLKMVSANEEIDLGKISASSIRYGSKKNYRYSGSFTTPPCKEGVIWTIADKIRSISLDQIKLIKALHQRGFQENARPVQSLLGRQVWKFELPEEKE
ncbi:hypothetical protein L1987_29404 [Smallanthus sonchifolius]|uniref:Uncharacterized protein n=1 Tax=Smallanthus sonchifolius TaxID=185202 RepID=A0ACB9HZW5_9ASTR|nr:hypothetical protein L1987_29404 [Smallanthus sonchifolius]